MTNPSKPWEEGDPNSKICIIGEAPSRNEMRQRQPFVGPAGKVLDNCLHNAQLVRRQCYILNVFNFQVKSDKKGNVLSYDGDILYSPGTGLTPRGWEESGPFRELLDKSDCNVYVPMGNTALSCFLDGYVSITKHRGGVYKDSKGRKFIPAIHPAAALRGQFLWRYLITWDLIKARKQSKDKEIIDKVDRHLEIDQSFNRIIEYLNYVHDEVVELGFDIEVSNHQMSCFGISDRKEHAMCIPLLDDRGQHRFTETEELMVLELLALILAERDKTVIGQNISFDAQFILQQNNIFIRSRLEDTMIANHILMPDFPKGLDFLASIHTLEPYWKDEGKIWREPWRDWDSFQIYNAKDAAILPEIWAAQKPMLENGYYETYRNTINLLPVLLEMQTRGVAIDRDRLAGTRDRANAKKAELIAELDEVADYSFNVDSPKQCQEYFYTNKGITPYKSRQTGRPTTDDKAMSRIYRRYNLREAKLVQEIRSIGKLIGTYLEMEIDKDDRLRCSYNPRGTVTGRLSSSKTIFGTGGNMQNLHPEFKEFIVAD